MIPRIDDLFPPTNQPSSGASSAAGTQRAKVAHDASSSAIYLLRTTQQHHVHLSAMADQKASILMGAAFVVMSILVGQLDKGGPSLPAGTLGLFALFSAVFAILAVIPRTQKVGTSNSNLLFFGTFADLPAEEYVHKMETLLRSDQDVHRMMLTDIHQMGRVLEKKFRYLAISYRLFLTGLFAMCIATLATY